MSLSQNTEQDLNKTANQTTQVSPQSWKDTRFEYTGMGDIAVGDLYQIATKNIPNLLKALVDAGFSKRKIDKEIRRANKINGMIYNGDIVGINPDGSIRYKDGFDEKQQLKNREDAYMYAIIRDLPSFRGFNKLSAPVEEKPVKEKPKEKPKFTGSTIKSDLTRRGVYNQDGTFDFYTHEKADTDAQHGNIVTDINRLANIKNHFRALHDIYTSPGQGDDAPRVFNYDLSDESSPFRTELEYYAAYRDLQEAENASQMAAALSKYGILDEENWLRTSNGITAPVTPPPPTAKTEVQVALEALDKRKQQEKDNLIIRERDFYDDWDNTIVPGFLSEITFELPYQSYLDNMSWKNLTVAENARIKGNVNPQEAANNIVSTRTNQLARELVQALTKEDDGSFKFNYDINDVNNKLNYSKFFDYIFGLEDVKDWGGGRKWHPRLVNTELGLFYVYDPFTHRVTVESFDKAPNAAKKELLETRLNLYLEYNKNGGILQSLKSLRKGGTLKLLLGGYTDPIIVEAITPDMLRKQEKEAKKAEQEARKNDPSIEDPEWIKWIDRGSGMADLLGLAASFVPVYGNAASGILGIAGTTGTLFADIARDGVDRRDFTKFGTNLGADVVGLIPGVGVAAKAKKVAKLLTSVAATANLKESCLGVITKLQGNNWDFSSLNENDWNDLILGVAPFLVGARSWVGDVKLNKLLNEANARGVKPEKALEDIKSLRRKGRKDTGVTINQQKAAHRYSTPNKLQEVAQNLWGNPQPATEAGSHLRIVTTPQTSGNTQSTIGKWVGKGIGAVKRGWKDFTTEIKGMIDEAMDATLDKNGGKLEQLKALRKGGIIKALAGLSTTTLDEWKALEETDTNKKDYIDLYNLYKKTSGITLDSNHDYSTDTDFGSFLLNDLLLKDLQWLKDNTSNIANPFSSNLENLKFEKPNTDLLNTTRGAITINANDKATKLKQDSIRDNLVLNLAEKVNIDSVRNNFDLNMALENLLNQNYTMMNQFAGTDPALQKQAMLGVMLLGINAQTQQNIANAQSLQLQYDKINELMNQQTNINILNHNENMSRIAAANTAITDLEVANTLNNAGVVTNRLAELALEKTAQAKEINSARLDTFNKSNAAAYDKAVLEITKKYEILPTDSEYKQLVKKLLYQEALQQLQQYRTQADIDAVNNFYGDSDFSLFKKRPNSLNVVLNTTVVSNKKGGKLDNKTRLEIENTKAVSRLIIQQMKNYDKGLDRLSKVTYKAILKSLGLK